MPLVFAAIMPHGDALIPGVGDSKNTSKKLTAMMRSMAKSAQAARLDALVLATPHGVRIAGAHSAPHGVRIAGAHSVGVTTLVAGALGPHLLEVHGDRRLARSIIAAAGDRGVPCLGVIFGGENVPLPMDWGTFVPLWFLAEAGLHMPVVVVCPSRDLDLDSLAALGEAIADIAERGLRRIGLIASADHAHAHDRRGPYGYHPSAAKFDRLVLRWTREGAYEKFVGLDRTLIAQALPDSPWQLAILAGAFRRVAFSPNGVAYDRPSYFGMICAEFSRVKPARRPQRR